jgi:hypothetical protein
MSRVLDPFRFVLIAVAAWMNERQLQVIDYLREQNRVLCEQLAGRRLRLNDDQRCWLAVKANGLGRNLLAQVDTIVTPETLMACIESGRQAHRVPQSPSHARRPPRPPASLKKSEPLPLASQA